MIEDTLLSLASKRPIFHSESDFKHAFAWQLQSHCPSADIRLEVNIDSTDKRGRVDILLREENLTYFIELKYRSVAMTWSHNREVFRLKNHGAQDSGCYNYIKDICRLESWTTANQPSRGYAIFLTNDAKYWTSSSRKTYYDAFRLHHESTVRGTLAFAPSAADYTLRAHPELSLRSNYQMNWKLYSEKTSEGLSEFRYLISEVKDTYSA